MDALERDTATVSGREPAATWLVGACFGGSDDQLPRFLRDGIWENGYTDKYLEQVRAMQPGDRIAIKAAYTRKHHLPFDNRGQPVAVMAIKATGIITSNPRDGRRVQVKWDPLPSVREWYFYTYQGTIWKLPTDRWMADALRAFVFEGQPQDIGRFLADPFWQGRYGLRGVAEPFGWVPFFEVMADALMAHRDERSVLVAGLNAMAQRREALRYLCADHYPDGTTGFVRDVCPFTVMGMFNRGTTLANRRSIASDLAQLLKVNVPVPDSFDGVPVLNNLKSWFFPYEDRREADHIPALWQVFGAALAMADEPSEETRQRFVVAFDNVNGRRGVAWNLTMGLYWVRPRRLLSLDLNSRAYIADKLNVGIARHGPRHRCNGRDYLEVLDTLEARFPDTAYPVRSFPELSQAAWLHARVAPPPPEDDELPEEDDRDVDAQGDRTAPSDPVASVEVEPYDVEALLAEGCFLPRTDLERQLALLKAKKNLILQGPPGTGKTWLAKRLAFALMGCRDESRLRALQFHANLSYEDFVRGWRPGADGKLVIEDGLFMRAVQAALRDQNRPHVVVIEEINRGNPAQVFGELLTLLEGTKRQAADALELSYPDAEGRRTPVHLPPNLHVIGTMNLADRSLALVDLALRRRFAFATLRPRLDAEWQQWVVRHLGVEADRAADIGQRLKVLNRSIAESNRLGEHFQVGHSFVTPAAPLPADTTTAWFREVVESEIGPLLDEYWFDEPEQARRARAALLQGW